MDYKLIIRDIKIALIEADYALNKDQPNPDKANACLCRIYRFIHYGQTAAGYEKNTPIPPGIVKPSPSPKKTPRKHKA